MVNIEWSVLFTFYSTAPCEVGRMEVWGREFGVCVWLSLSVCVCESKFECVCVCACKGREMSVMWAFITCVSVSLYVCV